MNLNQYIDNINQRYTLGNATEHTFRGDLQQLIESLAMDVRATNEPKRQECGAPDYILTKKDIPVGFIEAKDIGDKDLEGKKKTGNKEQFDRYKASLDNLMFTDYLNFHLYNDGELVTKIAIAEISGDNIIAKTENFEPFENLLKDFTIHVGQTIKSSKKLAEMMAGKARLLSDIIGKALVSDEVNHQNSTLKDQMLAFKEILIHDITPKTFADVYAQTIAYGMFAARLNDPTLETFSRQEAAELIPKSNPFLRKLFGYIAGPDIDDRIKWVVDSLTDIFLACNVEEILKNYGKTTKMEDPIIHFYETFLAEYDPKLRKARGVWYTPAPVVNFIVRAVDDILKTEFNLPQGLADTSKTKIKVNTQTPDKRSVTGYKQMEQEVHKVQILDPATGTGTFLAEVIKHVNKKFKGQEGIWSNYVEKHLLPRLNGFELLMASYAMAHLQLDLLLKETGFKATKDQRTRVYLTNSLEEYHPDTGTLFANWLSSEANEANHIKRDTPVMCIIGNPPYSGVSSNKGKWISDLIEDYKYVDGVHFNERKHWLNDDYVKFLRFGQHFIEKNGEGVLAFINPHGFLDNPTFRGMRWNLLKTYDKIYTIDLHGNNKRKETTKEGGIDQNVFDIMQGVSINILIKTGKKKPSELGEVYHYDLFGKRDLKYDFLTNNSISKIPFLQLTPKEPFYFFIPQNDKGIEDFNKGFPISDFFIKNTSGIQTSRDFLVIDSDYNKLETRLNSFLDENKSIDDIREEFFSNATSKKYAKGDSRGWKISEIRPELQKTDFRKFITKISYRPLDKRSICYTRLLVDWTRENIQKEMLRDNISITVGRQGQATGKALWNLLFIQNTISDLNLFYRGGGIVCPLYLYPENTNQKLTEETPKRTPNLNIEIVNEIAENLDLKFTCEKETIENTFAPIDILDYIYAVLHSGNYREKYKEFLKIDFPRVPYPKDKNKFWQLVQLGREIRQIHLLESPIVEDYITTYPKDGDNTITTKVGKKDWELFDEEKRLGRIWINEEQYFDNIPLVAWEFYIGGYQPAQKWLKDRKERILEFDDILHYQKIIVALTETDRLMKEIDKIELV
jgi:predicted helicase